MANYTQLLSNIAAKTTLGFANLIFLLAIALFAPAWTLRFWQALLYLLLFASSSAAITVYLWKRDQALLSRRISAGPIAEKIPRPEDHPAFRLYWVPGHPGRAIA